MNLTKTSTRLVAGAAALTLLLGACGDDDDDTTAAGSDDTAAATSDATAGQAGGDAFCQASFDAEMTIGMAQSGEEPADMEAALAELAADVQDDLDTVRAEAPEELEEDVTTVLDAVDAFLAEGDFSGMETEEFSAANTAINTYLVEECDFGSIEAELTEYAFEGMPTEAEAGPTVLTVENTGAELHEAVVMKVNDGVEESAEELLALPEEEAMTKVTPAGGAFAFPGQSASAVLDLEAGRYIVVCFLPVGATPEAMEEMEESGAEPQGMPHAMEGMVHEFTVS